MIYTVTRYVGNFQPSVDQALWMTEDHTFDGTTRSPQPAAGELGSFMTYSRRIYFVFAV